MTGAQGAAAFFAENPEIDTVLATSDGNVWLPADLNKAQNKATRQAAVEAAFPDFINLEV